METKGLYLCSNLSLQSQFSGDFDYTKDLRGRSNYLPHSRVGKFARATCADCDKTENEDGDMACSFCDPVWNCPYEQAKKQALAADLACTNTRYFLTEANHVGKFSRLPFVILDECDVLEGELMSYIEVSVTNAMRKMLDLPSPKLKTKESAWVEWFEKIIPKVFKKLEGMTPTSDDNLMAKRSYQAVLRLYQNLKRVAPEVASGGWVYTGYSTDGSITFKPIKVSKYGHEYLWRHAERWLCMSATIISPEEFVDSLGYEGPWEVVRMPSSFDPDRCPIYYTPITSMAHAQREEAWPKAAAGVRKLVDMFPDERVLIHSVSYAWSNYLRSELGPRAKTYLDRTEREKVITWFEETTDGVLIAPSLDRGYDGKDDLVRVVIITKLPYPNLGDQQVSARLYTGASGAVWYATQTARAFVQMAGRGMRHQEDWCKIFVTDSQWEKFWKDWKRGGVHRLIPGHVSDRIRWNGEYRHELAKG